VLQLLRHAEVGEQDQEHEEVVDGERFLKEVAAHELEALRGAELPEHKRGEHSGEAHPDDGVAHRLPHGELVGSALEHAQVEGEQQKYEDREADPKQGTTNGS
jgi:hypothetical protein